MFTFRCQCNYSSDVPAQGNYYVCSGDSYKVTRDVKETQIFITQQGQQFPDGASLFVGPDSTFSQVYVMNEEGKTVDTIR